MSDALIEAVAKAINDAAHKYHRGDAWPPTIDEIHSIWRRQARAALAAIEAQGFRVVPAALIDKFPEINMSNYDDDDVSALNQWGIEVVTLPKLTEGT